MSTFTSKERILSTIMGKPVDRVPIWPPIHWSPLSPEPEPGNWKAEPNYQEVLRHVRTSCDSLVGLNLLTEDTSEQRKQVDKLHRGLGGGYFDRRFFLAPLEHIETVVEPTKSGGKIITYIVHTPKGDLRSQEKVEPDVDTVWTIEPLIKDIADAEKVLSVPYRFEKPNLNAYFADVQKLGDRGVPICFVTTPMVMVSHLLKFQTFFEWIATERSLLEKLIDVIAERVAERLQYVLDHGVGPIIRFGGSEQATPPMMSKRMFKQFVLKYEGRLWQMVRNAGKIVWVHCHGKVETVIDDFVQGGVQLLDPVEPPPQGDIDIAEAKQRAASGPMTLIGNIELSDLCQRPPDEIELMVEQTICEGGRQHLILGTSDFPISAIDDLTRDNLIRFVEAGIKYGRFNNV